MEALQQLSELEYKHRYQDKTIPEYARHKKRFSDRTANTLTQSIITWIRLHGGFAERVNVQGRPIDRTKVVTNTLGQRHVIGSIDWIPGGGQRGSADIHATIAGRAVYVEIKIGRDRLSEHQKKYRDQVERAGAKYWIVRTFNDFIELYENFIQSD